MNRLAERKFPKRLILAAIILSCGLVMQAEPGAAGKARETAGRVAEGPRPAATDAKGGSARALTHRAQLARRSH